MWEVWVLDHENGTLKVVLTGKYSRCHKLARKWNKTDPNSVAVIFPYRPLHDTNQTALQS